MSGAKRAGNTILRLSGLATVLIWTATFGISARADDLGNAQLLIAGTRLTVSPEAQTVPFDTPTIVQTPNFQD